MAHETSQTVVVPPQTIVVGQGEVSRDIWYWKGGGRVRVIVDGQTIRELTYDPNVPHFFGDLAALLGKPRASTVETLTENTFLRIPYEPGKIETFLKAAPAIARLWLHTLARTAADGIEAMRLKQQALDNAKSRRQQFERIERSDKKKWRGVLFLTERASLKTTAAQPATQGLLRHLESLKLFGTKSGSASDIEPDKMSPELKRALF